MSTWGLVILSVSAAIESLRAVERSGTIALGDGVAAWQA